jgi:hypothetical protein
MGIQTVNSSRDEAVEKLLRRAMSPMQEELERDLWPQMLRRLDERPTIRVPLLDWGLLAALAVILTLSPGAIPLVLWHF